MALAQKTPKPEIDSNRVSLTIKTSKCIFNPSEQIKTAFLIKTNKEIKDARTSIKITDDNDETLFQRTYYKNSITKKQDYSLEKSAQEFKPGGYTINLRLTSKQKLVKETNLSFGIVDTESKLKVVLIYNFSESPLIDFDGYVNKDRLSKVVTNLPKILRLLSAKKDYFSVSPLLISELKTISEGNHKTDNKIKPKENRAFIQKSRQILKIIQKLEKNKNNFKQTISAFNTAKSPEKELIWQINANKTKDRPFLTNSSPSNRIIKSVDGSTLIFYSDAFTYGRSAKKRLIGANPLSSQKISKLSGKTGIYDFLADCAQKKADGQEQIVTIISGPFSAKYYESLHRNIKISNLVNKSKLSNSQDDYDEIDVKDSKINKAKLYKMLTSFGQMVQQDNNYYKKAVNEYLKYKHRLTPMLEKKLRAKKLKKMISNHFNLFSIRPELVTLTSSKGKIPIGIYSKANYNSHLKLVIKTSDFQLTKTLNVKVKPRENAVVMPVTALYNGKTELKLMLYAGDTLVTTNKVPVNVILPSAISKYLYILLAVIVLFIVGAFSFREVRHRKVGNPKK